MSTFDINELRAAVDYNPETGTFTWRHRDDVPNWWNTKYAGKPALTTHHGNGYLSGAFNNRPLKAHRAAFAIVHGYWPDQVDHINGVRDDNRAVNLRPSDSTQNGRNMRRRDDNTSGVTGVSWDKRVRKWLARIAVNQRDTPLGYFKDKADAVAARKAAERKYGFDPMHGRSPKARANRRCVA